MTELSPYITTYTGQKFHFLSPSPNEICIEDIAHALSNLCRYVGHCNSFYSVAQHSVFIARHMPKELALEGLLHDAAEAYIGDLASPIKRLCTQFKDIEKTVDTAIRLRFGLYEHEHPIVKEADMRVRRNEWKMLFPNHTGELCDFDPEMPPLSEGGMILMPMNPVAAKKLFMDTYQRINKGLPL